MAKAIDSYRSVSSDSPAKAPDSSAVIVLFVRFLGAGHTAKRVKDCDQSKMRDQPWNKKRFCP